MRNPFFNRLFTLQTILWASLAIFFGSAFIIWTRPMSPRDLALGLLCGVGAFIVFGIAIIAEHVTPSLVEIRLRLRDLELHYQATTTEAEILRLRASMRQLISGPSGTPETPLDPYILPDPDEPSDELPVSSAPLRARTDNGSLAPSLCTHSQEELSC